VPAGNANAANLANNHLNRVMKARASIGY